MPPADSRTRANCFRVVSCPCSDLSDPDEMMESLTLISSDYVSRNKAVTIKSARVTSSHLSALRQLKVDLVSTPSKIWSTTARLNWELSRPCPQPPPPLPVPSFRGGRQPDREESFCSSVTGSHRSWVVPYQLRSEELKVTRFCCSDWLLHWRIQIIPGSNWNHVCFDQMNLSELSPDKPVYPADSVFWKKLQDLYRHSLGSRVRDFYEIVDSELRASDVTSNFQHYSDPCMSPW